MNIIKEFTVSMDRMKHTLQDISDLLRSGTLALDGTALPALSWILKPLYESASCSIGLVKIARQDAGPCEPHIHLTSHEYLIVSKGKIMLYIDDKAIRMVGEGECASIPPGVSHFSRPSLDDTELIYVCVPQDEKIPSAK